MTLLNCPARGCAKRGTNTMTNDKNASLCPSSADGKEDGPGVLRGARPRPEIGQCQSSLVSQQLQKPHVISTSPGAILIDSVELKATFTPCPVVFSIIIKFISPDLPLWGRDWLPHFTNRYRNSKPLDLWHSGHLYPSLSLRLAHLCPRPYSLYVRYFLEILSKLILHGLATD